MAEHARIPSRPTNDVRPGPGGGNAALTTVLRRVRAEYLELPGMRLTAAQLQRLCGLDAATCARVLDALIETRFLRAYGDGSYGRSSDVSAETAGRSTAVLHDGSHA